MDLAMAQRLADRRKAAGLSQEALAAQLGVSRQAVSKWERSESSPDTDNLIALAALYGVSLDELLYGEAVDSTDDSQADDEAQNSNAGTKASDKAEEAEASTEHADCSDKPLVVISLARGIHVIDPTKAKRFMLAGMASMWLTSARVKRSMWGQADCISIRLRTMDIVCIPMTTAPSPSTARRFPAGRKHTTSSTITASISTPRSDVHGTNSPSLRLSPSPIWCSALSTAHGLRDSSSSF